MRERKKSNYSINNSSTNLKSKRPTLNPTGIETVRRCGVHSFRAPTLLSTARKMHINNVSPASTGAALACVVECMCVDMFEQMHFFFVIPLWRQLGVALTLDGGLLLRLSRRIFCSLPPNHWMHILMQFFPSTLNVHYIQDFAIERGAKLPAETFLGVWVLGEVLRP